MSVGKINNFSDKYEINLEKVEKGIKLHKTKTFWVGIVCIIVGVYFTSIGDKDIGIQLIMLGLGLLGLRDAIRKVQK